MLVGCCVDSSASGDPCSVAYIVLVDGFSFFSLGSTWGHLYVFCYTFYTPYTLLQIIQDCAPAHTRMLAQYSISALAGLPCLRDERRRKDVLTASHGKKFLPGQTDVTCLQWCDENKLQS